MHKSGEKKKKRKGVRFFLHFPALSAGIKRFLEPVEEGGWTPLPTSRGGGRPPPSHLTHPWGGVRSRF